jgi:rRNA maturation endonuclease Nob1
VVRDAGINTRARIIVAAVGQLRVQAINARMETGWLGFAFALIRGMRWNLTCGFCKRPFRKNVYMISTSAVCPYCGTRNLLPMRRLRPRSN